MSKPKKKITCFHTDKIEYQTLEPVAEEARGRGYEVVFTSDVHEKAEIGIYCQHECFPENSKLSVIMLHDLAQRHNIWPNIWRAEAWSNFDIAILPGESWAKRWTECSWYPRANPKKGVFRLGWPKADLIFKNKSAFTAEVEKLRASLNLRHEKSVLYAPSWENDAKQDEFVQSLRGLPVNLLLKQAPWSDAYPEVLENIAKMNGLHKNCGPDVHIIDPQISIMYCLGLSDIIVSEESSVVVEALLLDVPSLAVMDWLIPDTVPPRLPMVPLDFVVKTKKAGLRDSVAEMFDRMDEHKRRLMEEKKRYFSNLGESSEKIMGLLDAVVEGKKPPFEPLERKTPGSIGKRYSADPNTGVWVSADRKTFGYSDGETEEKYIWDALRLSHDVSCSSDEPASRIRDWPSEYHLSPSRHNVMIPLGIKKGMKVLELGCGMGAITRYLGETGAEVTALDGSLRRAAITRERCRDLNNVAIVCDNIRDFRTDEKFDMVTLIGVLEYSPKYIGGDDPVQSCLLTAKGFLKPDGVLVVAIENRLGLKYWNNCAEDHTGGMFDSIHDNYPRGSVATFGRAELIGILRRAGFDPFEFLYPFPDYKLTSSVLHDGSFENREVNFSALIGQPPSRDYSGRPYRHFSERLAWTSLEKNGLLKEMANSFVALAVRSGGRRPETGRSWIAKIYNSRRSGCFRTETTISKQPSSGEITVEKRKVHGDLPEHEGPLGFNHDMEKKYIRGGLFSDEILRLFLGPDSYEAFAAKMREYRDFVLETAGRLNSRVREGFCPGEMVDCTPFNLVRKADGTLHYIDNEWTTKEEIPLNFVLLRGIIGELTAKINHIAGPGAFGEFASMMALLEDLFGRLGMNIGEEDFSFFCSMEGEIQAQVMGAEGMGPKAAEGFEALLRLPVAAALNTLSKISVWGLCGLQDGELREKGKRLREVSDLCASAYCELAEIYFEAGQNEKAVEFYEKAAVVSPENIAFRKKAAEFLYVRMGKKEEAVQKYIEILKEHPEDVETLVAMGDFCMSIGSRENSDVFYQRALDLEPGNEIISGRLDALRKKAASGERASEGAAEKLSGNGGPAGSVSEIPAVAGASADKSLVSIVILTFNQLKYTEECIKSIRDHTPEPHEIIFVDNASTDGTVKKLRKLVKENPNCKLIENSKNLGFAKGCNQGIAAASGGFILLLNNDVVVTEGWLSGMLECLASTPNAGIVGPMTNSISGTQKVVETPYRTMAGMREFAALFRAKNRGRRIVLRRIVGFCMLFRRELVEKTGLLDETFGTGNFEDDDFCLRAVLEGYVNLVAGDVFIHHYGSRSFIGGAMNYASIMTGNRKLFAEKWSGIDSTSPLGRQLIVASALENASELYGMGLAEKAVSKLIEAMAAAPSDIRIYHLLGSILLDSKNFREALEALESMPEGSARDLESLVLAGCCKEGLELYDEARSYADMVLAISPNHAGALNLMGVLAYKNGDRSSARDYFEKACAADPGCGEPRTNLGILKWTEDLKAEAVELLEKGFILSPSSADSVTLYHAAVSATAEYGRAELVFREALDLHPLDKRLLFLYIDVLLNLGKNEDALARVERAMLAFGIDDGIIDAALKIRETAGEKRIDRKKNPTGTLSLCMIVKNEKEHIAKCLASAKPVADEMIVVDTGSTDRTRDIAKAFGARVFDFSWTDDFSAARNHSLSMAEGDWILVLDADEVLSPSDYDAIRRMVSTRKPEASAYSMVTRNYTNQTGIEGWVANEGSYPMEEAELGWFPSSKVRLFVNDDRVRFENPVHEVVERSLQRAGLEIRQCPIPVHHYGRLNAEKVAEKGEAYYRLGIKKLQEQGETPKALYELAVQAQELKKYEEALGLWQRLIAVEPDNPLAYFNMGHIYLMLEEFDEAHAASEKAYSLDPSSKEIAINYAMCEFYSGDPNRTISLSGKVLSDLPGYPSALAALSAAYYVCDRKSEAAAILEQLRKKGFDCAPFLYDTAKGLTAVGRFQQAMLLMAFAAESGNIHAGTKELLEKCYAEMSAL